MVGQAKSAYEVDLLVGQRVKRRRQSLGVSQGRLGGCLGLTFSQVQKYENGTNRIGAGRLHLLSMALEVPVQYFYQDLEDARAVAARNRQAAEIAAELAVLGQAFQSIKDNETRRSVLELVRSLAACKDQSLRS